MNDTTITAVSTAVADNIYASALVMAATDMAVCDSHDLADVASVTHAFLGHLAAGIGFAEDGAADVDMNDGIDRAVDAIVENLGLPIVADTHVERIILTVVRDANGSYALDEITGDSDPPCQHVLIALLAEAVQRVALSASHDHHED